jgi:CubicO group peptidase (beta-lactamase class C family)
MGLVEKLVEAEVIRFGVPGCAVTVVKDGEVVLARGFGQRDVDADRPVTEQTLFPIGSSSKAFTASVVATLVDEGRFDWDTPVIDLLPGFKMYDPIATLQLTPRDMLCHRSGLPRHDLLWYNSTELTRADIVRRLRHLEPNKAFRQTWQYNNLLYITAGHLIEHVLGCTWEEAVRDRLLDPLGMTNTNFSVHESAKSDDHSLPYNEKDGVTSVIPLRGLDLAGPAGSINSCIADMKQWALLNAGDGEVGGTRVLSTAALKELHSPTMVLKGELSAIADLYGETYMTAYALGWVLEEYRGHRIVHHGGNIDGFSAMVSLLPEQNLGVVVLTNLNGTFARDVIPYVVYDQALDLEPLPWGDRFLDLEKTMTAGMKAGQAHAESKTKDAPPAHALDEYAGTYAHPGYGEFGITVEGGKLVPHYNDIDEFVLEHRHFDVWSLKLDLFQAVMPLSFRTDEAGDVDAFTVPLEASVAPIVFERQPDPTLREPAVLQRYVGEYAMGPLVLTIELQDDKGLVGTLTGTHFELIPKRPHVFAVKDSASGAVEFVIDGDDVVKVVVDDSAVFERKNQ